MMIKQVNVVVAGVIRLARGSGCGMSGEEWEA